MSLQKLIHTLKANQRDRSAFFLAVGEICVPGSSGYTLIETAYNIAKDAHREQFRDSGERYFEHPRAVALIMLNHLRIHKSEAIAGGLVHDVPEDQPKRYPITRIQTSLGNEVASRVQWGNKRRFDHIRDADERLWRYHMSLLQDAPRETAEWKLPDRLHNLCTLWHWTKAERERKIRETKTIYLPLAEKFTLLIHELEEAVWALERGRHLLPPPQK